MSIVVSDASPLRALSHLKLLSLLQSIYGEVLIPPAVAEELANPASDLPVMELPRTAGIRVQAPANQQKIKQLRQTLDKGESEAIALAIETGASILLIDERAGRAIAAFNGLNILGVLGVLMRAKELNYISAVQPLLDELRSGLNFYISPSLYQQVLKRAGE